MKFLFDTDTITNILKKVPSIKLVAKLKALEYEQQFISTITISEIVYGAMKSEKTDFHLKNLENLILPTVNVIGFDSRAAFHCGRIRAILEQKGMPINQTDLQIASIAIANDLMLVTRNIKHFIRINELKVENWID